MCTPSCQLSSRAGHGTLYRPSAAQWIQNKWDDWSFCNVLNNGHVCFQVEEAGSGKAWNFIDLARRLTAEVIMKWGFRADKRCTDLSRIDPLVKMTDSTRTASECADSDS